MTSPDMASAEGQWQDIATAPRDGTAIIGLIKHGDVAKVWWQYFSSDDVWDWQDEADSEVVVTHWMPLPPVPAKATGAA